ncbi:MAG TPA: CheR family methyltransferase [Steroidobacteraceae bacterium]|nr:CheR family methyltransferase [Steroidobacteraceae bacterium]
MHAIVLRDAPRQQYLGTFFLRNRPQLEQIRRLIAPLPQGATLRLAILGCSIGAEVYSVLWTIRSARPDLDVRTTAADISPQVIAIAEKAVYSDESCGLVGESIFERLTPAEREQMFDWSGGSATVKAPLRAGISWRIGDASSAGLAAALGPQDMVLASNFLCHMSPQFAEQCLRNIARLVRPGGHLLVVGIDLDVREKVARDLNWHLVPDLLREIHDGDPVLRRDWPLTWWGLEPLDERRRDWQRRYAATFRLD